MLIKEEIFVIDKHNTNTIPYFTSNDTNNSVDDCLKYLKKHHIKQPTLYVGLWYEESKDESMTQRNWEISKSQLKKLVKLKGDLCISVY